MTEPADHEIHEVIIGTSLSTGLVWYKLVLFYGCNTKILFWKNNRSNTTSMHTNSLLLGMPAYMRVDDRNNLG